MSARLSSNLLAALALGLTLSVACAYPAPRGPSPLYDLDTTWFNDPIGGLRPWKSEDRRAATRASQMREARWLAAGAGSVSERPTSAIVPIERKTTGRDDTRSDARDDVRSRRKKRWKKNRERRAREKRKQQKKRKSKRVVLARIEAPPAAKPPPERRPGLLLGDGSVADELVVAAQRLVGIRDALTGPAFADHLLKVALGDLAATRGHDRSAQEIWEILKRSERTFSDPQKVRAGYLAFFYGTHDLDGDGHGDSDLTMAAVVERIRPSGVWVCIGEVHGEVRRFVVDPNRPGIRRDEGSSEVVNTPLRWRSFKDRSGADVLAGSLVAGFARM